MTWIDRICHHAFTLGLMLGLLVVVLTPLHMSATRYVNVSAVRPDNKIEVPAIEADGLEIGDRVQVFRFSPDWMHEIGTAELVETGAEQYVLRFDPQTYSWPMGRQGTIIEAENALVVVDVGVEIGMESDMILKLFDGRKLVGKANVVWAIEGTTYAKLEGFQSEDVGAANGLAGKTASEFTIPNQVTWFSSPVIATIEFVALAVVILSWLFSIVSTVPGTILSAVVNFIRRLVQGWPRAVHLVLLALLGVPACLVMGQLCVQFLVLVTELLAEMIGQKLPDISWIPWYAAWLFLGIWILYLAMTGRNPAIDLWNNLQYPRFLPLWLDRLPIHRGLRNWALHCFVFGAFAYSLLGFLRGNFAMAARIGWADDGLQFGSWSDVLGSAGWMLTHIPNIDDMYDGFGLARYILWSATIVGCMIGYGHSLASPIWNRNAIRSVDFTLVGWMVNLLCYAPWVVAVFRLFPHPTGADPTITAGPLLPLQLSAELLLNLLYTLSIFNMGKRFGVMVDKGLVSRGFYSVVRHPSYTLEPLMFTVILVKGANTPWLWFGLLAFPVLYWIRSERDDQFMNTANPDYENYRQDVPWKFLPGIY